MFGSISAIISWIFQYFLARYGRVAAVIVTFVAITVTFGACINLLVNQAISLISVPAWIAAFIGMWIPADFAACLSILVSGRICRAAYDLARVKTTALAITN
jgi:hypothetical protein